MAVGSPARSWTEAVRSHSWRKRRTSCSVGVSSRSVARRRKAPPAPTGDSWAQSPTRTTFAPASRAWVVMASRSAVAAMDASSTITSRPGRQRGPVQLGREGSGAVAQGPGLPGGAGPPQRLPDPVQLGHPVGGGAGVGEPLGGVLGGDADGVGEDVGGGRGRREPDHRPRPELRLPRRPHPAHRGGLPGPRRPDQHVHDPRGGHHRPDRVPLVARQGVALPRHVGLEGLLGDGRVDGGAVEAAGGVEEAGLGVEDLDRRVHAGVPQPPSLRPSAPARGWT